MANDPRFEVYPQTRRTGEVESGGAFVGTEATGEFGWRFRAANGRISAIGGEGFTRREDADRAVRHFLTDVGADHEDEYFTPPILDVDE